MSNHAPVEIEVNKINLPDNNSKKLYRDWLDHKNGSEIPDWNSFDPLNFCPSLPNLMIYDYLVEEGKYYVRIIGEDCSDHFHFKSKPGYIDDVIPQTNCNDVVSRLDKVKLTKTPHLVVKEKTWVSNEYRQERTERYTVLFLPFVSHKENIDVTILNYIHFQEL